MRLLPGRPDLGCSSRPGTMSRVTGSSWWSVAVGVFGGVLLLWVALMVALWFVGPDELRIRDALPLLPDPW